MPEYIQDAWPEQSSFCWGCGRNNEHGLQLKSRWEDDETVAVWEPKEHHMAFPGIMNGGIIATLIDCHGTGTANAAAHRASDNMNQHVWFVTAGLSVRFLRPTPLHRPVTLKAQVKNLSDNKITVSCELYSGEMKCATGEVTTVRVDIDQFLQRAKSL